LPLEHHKRLEEDVEEGRADTKSEALRNYLQTGIRRDEYTDKRIEDLENQLKEMREDRDYWRQMALALAETEEE